jgi:DHA2 family multidrug resistance protein
MDQRLMLIGGFLLNAYASFQMTALSLSMDYWSLAWPRFLQGFSAGFIFPPLQTLTLATIQLGRLGNATAAYNVVRNIGGSVGVAVATALLVRRSQEHQTHLVAHVDVWSPETARQLQEWTEHFMTQGADSFTAGRQALAMVYRRTTEQAQVLAYADDFWLISMIFLSILPLLPLMRRVHADQNERARASSGRVDALPVPEE